MTRSGKMPCFGYNRVHYDLCAVLGGEILDEGEEGQSGTTPLMDENGEWIEHSNTEGEMCYQGKNVTLGYALKKKDLILGDERQGFMRTGDLAYRDADGCSFCAI